MKKNWFLLAIALLLTSCGGVKVPNVVGQEVGYAAGMLKGQGLEVETITQTEENVTPNQVLKQEPLAQTTAKKGATIKLTVAKAPVYSIKGQLKLVDSDISGSNDNCYGTGGYSDIEPLMPVTVRDGQGNIIATGKTSAGSRPIGEFSSVICIFNFEVTDIPKSDFYIIEVGHRGELNYSFDELQRKNWEVQLSLG